MRGKRNRFSIKRLKIIDILQFFLNELRDLYCIIILLRVPGDKHEFTSPPLYGKPLPAHYQGLSINCTVLGNISFYKYAREPSAQVGNKIQFWIMRVCIFNLFFVVLFGEQNDECNVVILSSRGYEKKTNSFLLLERLALAPNPCHF